MALSCPLTPGLRAWRNRHQARFRTLVISDAAYADAIGEESDSFDVYVLTDLLEV